MKRRWIVVLTFAGLYVFNAYVCDDAFITFRAADNFVRGLGLRWNVGERVQVFTSPLFMFVFSGPYALLHDPSATPNPDRAYWLALALSFVLSLWMLLYLERRLHGRGAFWALYALLMSSQAFVTFTSSGLETPLVFLLVAVFFGRWLWPERRGGSKPQDRTRPQEAFDFLCAGLVVLTRQDLALMLAPALVHLTVSAWRRLGRRSLVPMLPGALPVGAWHLFSLVYFGFALPNSYYAKLGIDAPRELLWSMGRYYFAESLREDPISLLVCAAALAVCWTSYRTMLAGAGAFAHLWYIGSIGGDFLGFRFLAPAFLVSALILVERLEAASRKLESRARGVALVRRRRRRPVLAPRAIVASSGDS